MKRTEYSRTIAKLYNHGCEILKERVEYTLLRKVIHAPNFTEVSNFSKSDAPQTPINTRAEGRGVISYICGASISNLLNPSNLTA